MLQKTVQYFSKSNLAVAELQKAQAQAGVSQGIVKIRKQDLRRTGQQQLQSVIAFLSLRIW
jgi:hypothetical protein